MATLSRIAWTFITAKLRSATRHCNPTQRLRGSGDYLPGRPQLAPGGSSRPSRSTARGRPPTAPEPSRVPSTRRWTATAMDAPIQPFHSSVGQRRKARHPAPPPLDRFDVVVVGGAADVRALAPQRVAATGGVPTVTRPAVGRVDDV